MDQLLAQLSQQRVRITIEINCDDGDDDDDKIVREVVSTNSYTPPDDLEGTEEAKRFGFK
jgi:hypothetical protein